MSEPAVPHVVGVLLAAGAARRFGAPKQLAELDGQPLVLHALEHLLAVPALAEVVVVVGAHGEAVTEAVRATEWPDVRVVPSAGWAEGMAASLRTGIEAARYVRADAALVHLGDLPRITPQVIAMVLDEACDADGHLRPGPTRATYRGHDGHPVVLPRASWPPVLELRGDAGARDLLAGPRTRRVEAGHLADPIDIDTPDHLESLRT